MKSDGKEKKTMFCVIKEQHEEVRNFALSLLYAFSLLLFLFILHLKYFKQKKGKDKTHLYE